MAKIRRIPQPWWIEGTPGFYMVRLEHPQLGVRLEGVHSDTIANAEAKAEAAFPGYDARWSHRQPENQGVFRPGT